MFSKLWNFQGGNKRAVFKMFIATSLLAVILLFGLTGCLEDVIPAYEIHTVEDWNKAATSDDISDFHNTIKLMNDLDFSGKDFLTLDIQYCDFNGNGHALKNITINDVLETTYILTSESHDKKVYDLKIENVIINSSIKDADVSPFGFKEKSVDFSNVSITGTINAPFAYSIGGFCSNAANADWGESFDNCTSELTINGGKVAGGFVGRGKTADIVDCENKSTINTAEAAGGFVGELTGEYSYMVASGSKNSGNITSNGCAGGIIGTTGTSSVHTLKITGCENAGAVSGASNVGGIIGYQAGGWKRLVEYSIKNSTNNGTIISNAKDEDAFVCLGGISGRQVTGEIMGCVNNGEIKNGQYISGGIVGYCLNIVSGCENNGRVEAAIGAGGIIGFAGDNKGTIRISHCINNAEVSADLFAGGIVGVADLNSGDSKTYDISKSFAKLYRQGVDATLSIFNIKLDNQNFEDFIFNASKDILKLLTKSSKLQLAYCESNEKVSATRDYAGGFIGIMLSCSVEKDELATNTFSGEISCSGIQSDGFTYVKAEDIYKID